MQKLNSNSTIIIVLLHNEFNILLFRELINKPYSPDLAPSDYWLFVNLKRMLQGKRFGSNEEVILETEVYFEAKEKSFNKNEFNILLFRELINKPWYYLMHTPIQVHWEKKFK